jgi:hypothetical protein
MLWLSSPPNTKDDQNRYMYRANSTPLRSVGYTPAVMRTGEPAYMRELQDYPPNPVPPTQDHQQPWLKCIGPCSDRFQYDNAAQSQVVMCV